MVLPLYVVLERLDWSLVDAAHDLGDGPLRAFRRITLPLAVPGIVSGSLLVFIPLTGEYLIPAILGGNKTAYTDADRSAVQRGARLAARLGDRDARRRRHDRGAARLRPRRLARGGGW